MWRAIGDTNLRFIRKLSLFCRAMEGGEYATKSIMARYRKPAACPQLTKMPEKGLVVEVPATDQVTLGGIHYPGMSMQEREEKLRRILGVVAIDGLHVRALANVMVLLMSEYSRQWLPDFMSLQELQF
jgi:hypothetical protein